MGWKDDLEWSARVFTQQIWPIMRLVYHDSELIHIETIKDSELAKKFDQLSGIDAWQIHNDTNIRGIASRVQKPPKWSSNGYPYNTFTIRKSRDTGTKTEYEKRLYAINSSDGWIYPYLTVQAYVNAKGRLLSFATARTVEVIQAITEGRCLENRTNNAEFYAVEWSADLCEIIYQGDKITSQLLLPPSQFILCNILTDANKLGTIKQRTKKLRTLDASILEIAEAINTEFCLNCGPSDIDELLGQE